MASKTMWGSGNYAAVAEKITDSADRLVQAAAVEPGMEVLDVACGTGNVAIPAVKAGARATALDFSPELLEVARERAADAMVEVDWVEGDAQDLPFEDASFDRVLSAFGHMFAPDHARTAEEMKRVCRPGGVIGICCWSPTGAVGRMFATVGQVVGGPPPEEPPPLWGTEEHVRKLLGEARFERGEVVWRHESVEGYADFMLESFGPLLNARETLGERGGELRDALIAYYNDENLADDGTLRFNGDYLIAVVPKP
jgi:SAM-dependent methyltransferase